MTQRIVNLAAVLIVLFVAVGISAAFIYGKFNPPRPDPGPRISEFKVASHPPPPANETTDAQPATAPLPDASRPAEKPPEAPRQPEEPPKTYTWAEVEQLLAAVREERKASTSAWIELENWYARLSSPEFTQSKGHSEHIKKLQAWQAEFPESPNPRVVLGRAYIGYAWDARGSGFALSVSDAGWELFHQRIDESYRLLNESLDLGVKDGEVYARLIDVAKAQSASPDDAHEWVEAGIKADATYFPLYQSMAEYLLPRWHGEPGDVERFANSLPEKIPDDNGLIAMAMVARQVHFYDRETLFRGKYDAALLGKAGATIATRYPDLSRLVNFGALCIWRAQDHESAQIVRPLIENHEPDNRVWSRNSHLIFTKWASAPTVPGGEEASIWATQLGCMGIAFAPNERYLWMAEQYGQVPVKLWDLQSTEVRGALPGVGRILDNFALSGEQKVAVASFWNGPNEEGGFQGIVAWDTTTSEIIAQHPTSEKVVAVAANPAARQIAWGQKDAIHLLDLEPGAEVRTISFQGYPMTIAFAPDGKRLGTGQAECIVVDATSGKLLFKAASNEAFLQGTFLSLDNEGRALTVASRLQPAPSSRCIVRFSQDGSQREVLVPEMDHRGMIYLSPDCRLAAITTPGADQWKPCGIEIWDLASGKKIQQLPGHWSLIGKVCFSSDGRRLASVGIMPDVIKIWSLDELDLSKPSP